MAMVLLSIFLASLLLFEAQQVRAVRQVVAWVTQGEPINGVGEEYPDLEIMRTVTLIYVTSDVPAQEAVLQEDPRIRWVTRAEFDNLIGKLKWNEDSKAFLLIEIKSRTPFTFTLNVENTMGPLAGHGYEFTFRAFLFRLYASAEFLWVS